MEAIPAVAAELIRHLDVENPEMALARSMHITDDAVELAAARIADPVHLAGVVSALMERELWELPSGNGTMVENVALARRLGGYYTPPSVAWYITVRTLGPVLQEASRSERGNQFGRILNLRIVDPCCGAGIFLACALELLLRYWDHVEELGIARRHPLGSRDDFSKHIVYQCLYGVDISKRAVESATMLLGWLAKCPPQRIKGIVRGDALTGRLNGRSDSHMNNPHHNGHARPLDWTSLLPEGADAVLLNPPYGRLRVLKSEFSEKSRGLRLNHNQHSKLIVERNDYIKLLQSHFRSSSLYASALGGVLDWQRLFLARSLALLCPGGRLGAIVPASIVADKSASLFRHSLFAHTRVSRIDRLPESAALFPTVNQPTCVLVTEKGRSTETFVTSKPTTALPPKKHAEFTIQVSAVRRFSPSELAIPAADREGWRILKCLHKYPNLKDDPRMLNVRGEFDLTLHKRYLGQGDTRLVRGDHVERFRFRGLKSSKKVACIEGDEFTEAISGSSKVKHKLRRRVVGRQCAYLEKNRRLSFTIIDSGFVVANSCNYLLWEGSDEEKGLLFICGLLNSALLEWRFRLTSSNNHVNNYEIDALPVPPGSLEEIAGASRQLLEASTESQSEDEHGPSELESGLDAIVLRAYRLDRSAARRIMSNVAPERCEEVLELLKAAK